MRLSDRYLARSIITGTLTAVILLSVVLIMGIMFQEIQDLLVRFELPPLLVGKFLLYNLPYPLMFTLPWGFLLTVLLTMGRLSKHNELVGFRTSGVSLVRLVLPVFILGLFFSGVCWFLVGVLAPYSKFYSKKLIDDAVENDPIALLEPNAVQTRLPGQRAFVSGKEGDTLHGIHFYQLDSNKRDAEVELYVHAESATLEVDKENSQFLFSFREAFIDDGESFPGTTASTAEPWPIPFPSKQGRKIKPSYRTNTSLIATLTKAEDEEERLALLSEFQKRQALSLACLAFSFIGVPLGITGRRKESNRGLILSLIVAGAYFGCLLMAENFEKEPALAATLYWSPNIFCLVVGIWLLRRASRR
ncbi:MAG: LptF/LptG family permease [Verrucomicrobiota bacterium JB023]|nr:LptF/LptG family permease [Verrucomicrobiota bacterium JB023]